MMHAQSRRRSAATAGTAILGAIAVLTLAGPHEAAKDLLAGFRLLLSQASAILWQGYHAAPAVTVGLLLALCLPVLAIFVRASRPLTRSNNATRPYRPGKNDKFDANVSDAGNVVRLYSHPFVEIENGRGMRCSIQRDMLRIGREDDNDIRIPSRYVHRYHAAIHREDFDDWHITDLTGVESNGLIVNGKRCCEARLRDGDLIELGPGKLRFRAGAR